MLTPERGIHIPRHSWWSDTIKDAHLVVQYWKIRVSLLTQPQYDESILDGILDKLGPGIDVNQAKPNLVPTSQLRRAIKYRKQCRNNSFKLCQEFLEELAEESIDGDTTKDKAKIIKNIQHHKSSKQMYRIL